MSDPGDRADGGPGTGGDHEGGYGAAGDSVLSASGWVPDGPSSPFGDSRT